MRSSVSIVKCRDYEEEKVLTALRQAIDLIGGIQAFVVRAVTSSLNRISYTENLQKKL